MLVGRRERRRCSSVPPPRAYVPAHRTASAIWCSCRCERRRAAAPPECPSGSEATAFAEPSDAYRQVKGRLHIAVRDLGHQNLKNIAEPVRVYSLEVGQPVQAKPGPALASEKSAPRRLV